MVDTTLLRKLIDEAITLWATGSLPDDSPDAIEDKPEKPKDKRVVRTKSTGDRVYLIDEIAKSKAWVTSPEILTKLGFTTADVEEIDDKDLIGYQMSASIFKVD